VYGTAGAEFMNEEKRTARVMWGFEDVGIE